MIDIFDKLNAHTIKDPRTGCWLYTKRVEKSGYADIHFRYRTQRVHRVSAHIHLGYDLTDKTQQVNHKCEHRNCWNPEHLYLGSQHDNMQDKNKQKTHCIRGHEFTTENTIWQGDGSRKCAECNRTRMRLRYHGEKY